MSKQEFSVPQIKEGTVIDHIPHGQSLRILEILKIRPDQHAVTVGMNLNSPKVGLKDIIKIYKEEITQEKINDISVFAPTATINFIQNFKVIKKTQAALPKTIERILICPNKNCITMREPIDTCFQLENFRQQILLKCKYCEKFYSREQINEYHK